MYSKFNNVHEELVKACNARFNVLLSGPHGIGKTAMVMQVAEELNFSLKTFSASTLDPFADLVGIPATYQENGIQKIHYLRPEEINNAEVLFFDELNRAHPRTLNAVLEIIQFRKINGTPLPNLKLVIAAINSGNNHYQVVDLDPALLDRFHVQIDFNPGLELDYFTGKLGNELGQALFDWYKTDLSDQQKIHISPRRLEYIGQAIQQGIQIEYAMPLNVLMPVHLLKARLEGNIIDIEDFVSDPGLYSSKVSADMNLAIRFAQLVVQMKPKQLVKVYDIFLSLPPELLAKMKVETPFIFKNMSEAITRHIGIKEAQAFNELLHELLTRGNQQCLKSA